MPRSAETLTRNGSGGPLSPPPLRRPKPEYLPAYLSNGFLGVRVGTIPLVEGLVIVSGLRAVDSVHGIETFARGPYPFSGDIEINGQKMSRSLHDVRFIEQVYDFSCGELHSRFEFRAQGVTATVNVVSLCSRSLPTAVLQEIEVRVDHACQLQVSAGLDQTGVPGRLVARAADRVDDLDSVAHGSLLWETNGALSRCGAAYVTSFEGATEVEERRQLSDALAPLSTSYGVHARSGRRYVLRQISVLVASALHAEPDRQACRLVSIGQNRGFDGLRDANREAWSEDLDKSSSSCRRQRTLAGDLRCGFLLSTGICPPNVTFQHRHVRPGFLARLLLLLRPRHVGHRDVRLSTFLVDCAEHGTGLAGLPLYSAAGGQTERVNARVRGDPVSLGEQR